MAKLFGQPWVCRENSLAERWNHALGIGERSRVHIVLQGTGSNDQLAALPIALSRSGESDRQKASRSEDVADELGSQSRGDFADACDDNYHRCALQDTFPNGNLRRRDPRASKGPDQGSRLDLEGDQDRYRTVGSVRGHSPLLNRRAGPPRGRYSSAAHSAAKAGGWAGLSTRHAIRTAPNATIAMITIFRMPVSSRRLPGGGVQMGARSMPRSRPAARARREQPGARPRLTTSLFRRARGS